MLMGQKLFFALLLCLAPVTAFAAGSKLPPTSASAAVAAFETGKKYFHGTGVRKDYRLAIEWYRKAGDYPPALAGLGFMYDKGLGMRADPAIAAKLYTKAADAGDTKVMANLGLLYATGRGVPLDGQQAIKWYSRGAAANNENAMFNMGAMYALGKAVPADYPTAADWLRKALARARETHNAQIAYAAEHDLKLVEVRLATKAQPAAPRRRADTCSTAYLQAHSHSFGDLVRRSFVCAAQDRHPARRRTPVEECNADCARECDNGGTTDTRCYNRCIQPCWLAH